MCSRATTWPSRRPRPRSEEHTSELQSQSNLVCRLLLEKKNVILDSIWLAALCTCSISVSCFWTFISTCLLFVTHPYLRLMLLFHFVISGPHSSLDLSDL